MDGANRLSPGHHTLRLTCGPAGNRTATGGLSATLRTSPYQLLHRDAYHRWNQSGRTPEDVAMEGSTEGLGVDTEFARVTRLKRESEADVARA